MLRPPRVLQVFGSGVGGVPEHVLRLSRGLREGGWDVEAVGPSGSPYLTRLESAGVAVHDLPFSRKPEPADVQAARTLRALVRSRRPDLVHAHSSKAGALVRLGCPGGVPIVYTPHCFAFAAGLGAGPRLAYRAVEQLLVGRADAIVAVSGWEHAMAARALRGLAVRAVLVRNGVPAPEPASPPPGIGAWARGRPLLGYVGRLDEEKGPLRFLRAFATACAAEGFDAVGVVAGDGRLEREVRAEAARLRLGARVRCEPYGGRMAPWLAALDLYVLASRWESLPIAVLEAMRAGVPVLATDVGGVSEAVQDGVTGRLVAPGDHAALAGALVELAADRDRLQAMGRAAAARAAPAFSAERMVVQTAALYRTLLARREALAAAPA